MSIAPAPPARPARQIPTTAMPAAVPSQPGAETAPGGRMPRRQRGTRRHELVAVGPGRIGRALPGGFPGLVTNPLPFQPAKVHCPPPRRDILTRERLNSWLDHATSARVALVVAEAGFGKTTLLADWARHTRRRTTWYRLETDDRDWLTFVRHLLAGGREVEAEFGPATFELLQSLGPGGPTQRELFTSIARELADLGQRSEHGLTLILDDLHAVDGCADVEPVIQALLDRTGPGFSVVIASRTDPSLPMGKVRARGGVDSLAGEDLCFDPGETERLFRDAYRHPLDADVLVDLHARTEGWAALLTLVRTGLDEQTGVDAHTLVASLDPASGDLYEFLAEEVTAGLPAGLQHFLTRVALLIAVDLDGAALVIDASHAQLAAYLRDCERLGLLARPDRGSPHHFHPLVREFLLARLTAEIGAEEVQLLHLKLAVAMEGRDWYASAWHYLQAGAVDDSERVVDDALPTIIATGAFDRGSQVVSRRSNRPSALVIRSRLELDHGNVDRAIELAREASDSALGGPLSGVAMLNLSAILARHGFDDQSATLASTAIEHGLDTGARSVAEALLALRSAQEDGDLVAAADLLAQLALDQDQAGQTRYAAVTRVNLAVLYLWAGRPIDARRTAALAESGLTAHSDGPEHVAATAAKLAARVHLGDPGVLAEVDALVAGTKSPTGRDEAAIEAARLLVDYGSRSKALLACQLVSATALKAGYLGAWRIARGTIALQDGQIREASDALEGARTAGVLDAAGRCRILLLGARIAAVKDPTNAVGAARELATLGRRQRSDLMAGAGDLLEGLATPGMAQAAVLRLSHENRHLLSVLAEEVCRRLGELSGDALASVRAEAQLRPDRWRPVLRSSYANDQSVARLLAEVGAREDAGLVRATAASKKWLRPIAAAMTRRLAPRVHIADLGPVRVSLGDEALDRAMRRKVLALLCFASSRVGMAATRDEILEAIWPDLSPDTAGNSLHQTIYYLRRVFEPDYREGMSAGYVLYDGEVLSLSEELVSTDSRRCWEMLDGRMVDLDADPETLLEVYSGTYALDFAYEDWASGYRDRLHAAVLSATEKAAAALTARGEIDRAVRVCQQILAVDPTADALEYQLLRAYKAGGRNAAASEQYAHYASYVRGELGAEPPPFREI